MYHKAAEKRPLKNQLIILQKFGQLIFMDSSLDQCGIKICLEKRQRIWIVNSKLNNFFKVILPVLNWCQVTERGMKSVIVKPIHIISKLQF